MTDDASFPTLSGASTPITQNVSENDNVDEEDDYDDDEQVGDVDALADFID